MLGVLQQEDKGMSKAGEDKMQKGFGWAAPALPILLFYPKQYVHLFGGANSVLLLSGV